MPPETMTVTINSRLSQAWKTAGPMNPVDARDGRQLSWTWTGSRCSIRFVGTRADCNKRTCMIRPRRVAPLTPGSSRSPHAWLPAIARCAALQRGAPRFSPSRYRVFSASSSSNPSAGNGAPSSTARWCAFHRVPLVWGLFCQAVSERRIFLS
jgi:hypothetical protein